MGSGTLQLLVRSSPRYSGMTFLQSRFRSSYLFEHDLFLNRNPFFGIML